MSEEQLEALDAETRRLREAIYGPCTDSAWENMRANWIKDIAWLRAAVKQMNDHASEEKAKKEKQPANPLHRQ